MAIQATVDLGNGVSATDAYLIIPAPYVVDIYQNKAAADTLNMDERIKKRMVCRTVDHFKITYDPTSGEQNAFKLAYADLKTNSSLSSVTDA